MTNTTGVWLHCLQSLRELGEKVAPRGLPCQELTGFTSVIDMNDPVVLAKRRNLGYKFMAAEAHWILTGDNRVKTIAPYSPQIKRFSDDGYSYFGAYGPMVMDQIYRVAATLARDPDSRQAVITIWRPNPPETKDVPCTVSIQWLIRGGKLHCIDDMRSSDIWLGWPYDVFNFSCITWYLKALLKDLYKMDVEAGNLLLFAGSQHYYHRDETEIIATIESGEVYDVDLRLDRIFKDAKPDDIVHILDLAKDAKQGFLSLAESHK